MKPIVYIKKWWQMPKSSPAIYWKVFGKDELKSVDNFQVLTNYSIFRVNLQIQGTHPSFLVLFYVPYSYKFFVHKFSRRTSICAKLREN